MLGGAQGRTIFLSDSAVVARRDGDLNFMFRIADIRPRYQVRIVRVTSETFDNASSHVGTARFTCQYGVPCSWYALQLLLCTGRGLHTLLAGCPVCCPSRSCELGLKSISVLQHATHCMAHGCHVTAQPLTRLHSCTPT